MGLALHLRYALKAVANGSPWSQSLWHPGRVRGCVVIAGFPATRDTEQDAMDILDILLLALVLWIAVDLLNDGGWGGGKRRRNLILCPAQPNPA